GQSTSWTTTAQFICISGFWPGLSEILSPGSEGFSVFSLAAQVCSHQAQLVEADLLWQRVLDRPEQFPAELFAGFLNCAVMLRLHPFFLEFRFSAFDQGGEQGHDRAHFSAAPPGNFLKRIALLQ